MKLSIHRLTPFETFTVDKRSCGLIVDIPVKVLFSPFPTREATRDARKMTYSIELISLVLSLCW